MKIGLTNNKYLSRNGPNKDFYIELYCILMTVFPETTITGKIFGTKEIIENWTGPENFDICLWMTFDRY